MLWTMLWIVYRKEKKNIIFYYNSSKKIQIFDQIMIKILKKKIVDGKSNLKHSKSYKMEFAAFQTKLYIMIFFLIS